VDKISKVVATIDVDGMSMNLSDNVIPLLYDEDGNEVDITRLTLSSDTVAISAKILSVKEIPLAFSTTGTPYGDYRVVEISSTPKTIKLKGTSTVLNPLISIEVPGDVLNVSGAHEDITTTIDITEYLPDGAELVDASEATITVTVRIEPYESKTYQLSSDSISVVGLGDGYEISYTKDSIPVTISGLKKDLNKLTVATLLSSIDVSGLGEGTHQVTLNLELDEESYAYQPIRIEIQISRVKDTQDDNSTDSTDNDDGTDSNDDEEEN
jgi:YbbR domain-containing protein